MFPNRWLPRQLPAWLAVRKDNDAFGKLICTRNIAAR